MNSNLILVYTVYILFVATVWPDFLVIPHHVNSSGDYEFGPKNCSRLLPESLSYQMMHLYWINAKEFVNLSQVILNFVV